MSNKVSYDFVLDSCVAVDAPIGTNPETLIEQAKAKFIERIFSIKLLQSVKIDKI